MDSALAFLAVAALLSLTPGATTALVVRSALRGGRREALATTAGNEVGVLTWALLSALGISAVVAASQVAFEVLKLAGAAFLVVLGVATLVRARRGDEPELPRRSGGSAFRDGIVTSLANPKLSVFFVALFPQFVPDGAPVLPLTVAMGFLVAAIDLAWYSLLALLVTKAHRAFRQAFARHIERLTGAVLVALGLRLAAEQR
ncbi:MAG TPA: LysE family translocator [Solirubrobacteraceae bacterium]